MLYVDPLTAPPDCDLVLPGSKSITNRALIAAGLATGTSTLEGVLFAEDTRAMMDCLVELGASIEPDERNAAVRVTGVGGQPQTPASPLWVRQSGTTARFIVPVAALTNGSATVDGDEQIRGRPQADLVDALTDLGCRIESLGSNSQLPLRFAGDAVRGGEVRIAGDTSSQFLSGLLLAAPAMADGLAIELFGPVISRSYIDMTVAVMRLFGATIDVIQHRESTSFVVAPTGYVAQRYRVEPDASTASYFFAAAAVSGGRVRVLGLGSDSLQGDARFVQVLADMGAEVSETTEGLQVRGTGELAGIDLSMADISDTAPTLGAIASLASSATTVRDVGFIRFKESDRIAAVVNEVTRAGGTAVEAADGFSIEPSATGEAVIDTYDDHRIAMAFTVLGLARPGITIGQPGCVAKTFPEFFDAVDALRAVGDADLGVLAIDGPAGSGKSTVANLVAAQLGLEYLDTGAMYRSVTYAALQAGIDISDAHAVASLARVLSIDVGAAGVTVGGVDATDAIRTAEVNASVSEVSTHSGVRASMRRQQRAWARRRGGGVLEGRDIGSVVFPDARLKVYITAAPEERARRRSDQSGRPYDEILSEILGRDEIDSSRADSPLVEAAGATVVDTTGMTIDEVVDTVAGLFR